MNWVACCVNRLPGMPSLLSQLLKTGPRDRVGKGRDLGLPSQDQVIELFVLGMWNLRSFQQLGHQPKGRCQIPSFFMWLNNIVRTFCRWLHSLCLSGKESASIAGGTGDKGLIPGSERPPLEEEMATHSSIIAENPRDRRAWQATGHEVAKNQTRLSDLTHTGTHIYPSIKLLPHTSDWTIESKVYFLAVSAFLFKDSLEPAGAVHFPSLLQVLMLIFLLSLQKYFCRNSL